MKRSLPVAFFLALASLGAIGCGGDEETPVTPQQPPAPPVEHLVSFVGNTYDGASGTRLTAYTLQALVGDATIEGTVDADGRFVLADLPVWQDYTVVITADGYRAFRSHNAGVDLPISFDSSDDIAEYGSEQTFHYDAYLFPADLQVPAVTLTIEKSNSSDPPAGKIRLRPTSSSVLADEGAETPGGVPGQIWGNDEDVQNAAITADFSGGMFSLEPGALVYGVAYQVDIFDVPGYQPYKGTFIAGVEAGKRYTLAEEIQLPLELESNTAASCAAPASPSVVESAVVTFTFSREIELAESSYTGGVFEALDDGLSISSPDADADLVTNTLNTDGLSTSQTRGVMATVTGTTLKLAWNPSVGLATSDPEDPIDYVTYSNLGSVRVQALGSPSTAVTLSTLYGSTSITCY